MCPREQLGNDLKRAVRDLVCDENFDESSAPRFHLDFEILVSTGAASLQGSGHVFLVERKSFGA